MKVPYLLRIWRLLIWSGSYRFVPHGFDCYFDIRKNDPFNKFKNIFDVGANRGQSLYRISHAFPGADIYCFEPIQSTFNQLIHETKKMKRVHCFQKALGSTKGTAPVELQDNSCCNSLKRRTEDCKNKIIEDVQVDTIDSFCKEKGIRHIDFLKIDTEGFDLDVLKGSERLLSSGNVAFVQVEAGVSLANNEHVPFGVIRQHLEERGYVLFGVYDQILDWTDHRRLNFCNAVFVNSRNLKSVVH